MGEADPAEDRADDNDRRPAGPDDAVDERNAAKAAGPHIAEPTPDELAGLTVMERMELLFQERQFQAEERERGRAEKHRRINTVALVLGVIVGLGTVVGAVATLRATQDQLRIAQDAEITDRYATTIEALSSQDPLCGSVP